MTSEPLAASADWLREFDSQMTVPAKRRLERDPDVSVLIVRAIEAGWSVEALVVFVENGIGWQQPENARELMIWRLNKACGDVE